MGAEASVTLIVVLSIRLYHVPYGKPVAIALAVTSKLPSTKTSLSCVFARAAFDFNGLRQGRTLFIVAVPIKRSCFQANHLCPIRINFTSTVVT
jgi:hypothetical protein